MRSRPGCGVAELVAGLDTLAAADVVGLDDASLRDQLSDLVTASRRLHAELLRRVDVFDRRRLAEPDGFRTSKAWLQAFTRVSGAAAHRWVKAARVLRQLPRCADAAQAGQVPEQSVQELGRLADQVGVEAVAEVEATLAQAAGQLDRAGSRCCVHGSGPM